MKTVIIGGGGHGRVIIDIVEKAAELKLVGIIDAQLPIGERILGYEVIGREKDLPQLIAERRIRGVVIAIGDNWVRSQVATLMQSLSLRLEFPNAVHPAAQLAKGVRLGRGNVIMAGCVINSNATIGDFCILNTNCSVDHDSRVGDFASFAPNACAGGNVTVGDYSAVCLGANIVHRCTIGAHTVVGAGATVLGDLPSRVVAYGTPARAVRERFEGESYLEPVKSREAILA
jgi:sugar O-acyltransferase (sialic acid O-acetyltransferase NeuD family)